MRFAKLNLIYLVILTAIDVTITRSSSNRSKSHVSRKPIVYPKGKEVLYGLIETP